MRARGQEIAFGFKRNLTGFKEVVPEAKNFVDLGLDPRTFDFGERILDEMGKAGRIHFDLSGMRMLNCLDGVLKGASELNPVGSTNWELRTIWDDPILRRKTTFYRDGLNISTEEVRRLP